MKLKLHHILTALLLAILPGAFNAVYAQEYPTIVSDTYESHTSTDRVIYSHGGETVPGSGSSNSKQTTTSNPPKDSVLTAPARQQSPRVRTVTENVKPSQVSNQDKEDESMLSFNFLYYIIKKYKLQDIVD